MVDDDREIEISTLGARLGVRFSDAGLLRQALTHSSFINELGDESQEDSQRLEFLGDAVLDLIVGEWLYRRYPKAREGELTRIRAYVVRTEGLASLAVSLDLGASLVMGHGEARNGGAARPANLCAAFEALVGALYLDQGMAAVSAWVGELLDSRASEIDELQRHKDAKTRLQEYAQGQLHLTPAYRITNAIGPDHKKRFTAQALVGDRVWGEGEGQSKQSAQQAAAAAALEALAAAERDV